MIRWSFSIDSSFKYFWSPVVIYLSTEFANWKVNSWNWHQVLIAPVLWVRGNFSSKGSNKSIWINFIKKKKKKKKVRGKKLLWLVTLTLTNPRWVHYQWRSRFFFLNWCQSNLHVMKRFFLFFVINVPPFHFELKFATGVENCLRQSPDAVITTPSASSTCQESNYANSTHTCLSVRLNNIINSNRVRSS